MQKAKLRPARPALDAGLLALGLAAGGSGGTPGERHGAAATRIARPAGEFAVVLAQATNEVPGHTGVQ